MPNMDGTGPEGKGPKTGRQRGKCSGAEGRGQGRVLGPCGKGDRKGLGRRFNNQ